MTNKTITRSDLVASLKEQAGLSQIDCSKLLEGVLKEIADALSRGEQVKITSFATFKPHQKNARIGRNPKNGEEVRIPPRKVVLFRPSGVMRAKINRSGD